MFNKHRFLAATCSAAIALASTASLSAVTINWTDWTADISSSTPEPGFTAVGNITTSTTNVDVTYQNDQGIGFFQTGTGFDYFRNSLGPADSPYTSSYVENIPTASEMIALRFAGPQTLSFSQTVENLVFSYVSLNGNGYAFDQDFDILSFGDVSDGNRNGFWGPGTSYKSVVDLGGGNFEYQLLGTGEPHGTIRFRDTFDTVTWRSSTNEYWNGFTVGVEGTQEEVSGPPSPPSPAGVSDNGNTAVLALLGLSALLVSRKRFHNQTK